MDIFYSIESKLWVDYQNFLIDLFYKKNTEIPRNNQTV